MSTARRGVPVDYVCEGFTVTTFDGEKLGTVAGVANSCFVIELGRRPFRQWRAIPYEHAYPREASRTVVVLASGAAVLRSPRLHKKQPLDEAAIGAYYRSLPIGANAEGALRRHNGPR